MEQWRDLVYSIFQLPFAAVSDACPASVRVFQEDPGAQTRDHADDADEGQRQVKTEELTECAVLTSSSAPIPVIANQELSRCPGMRCHGIVVMPWRHVAEVCNVTTLAYTCAAYSTSMDMRKTTWDLFIRACKNRSCVHVQATCGNSGPGSLPSGRTPSE